MSKKVRVNAKEVLEDISSGMDDRGLMKKYNLSEQSLQSLFRKLKDQGLLRPPEPEKKRIPERTRPISNSAGSVERNNALIEASLQGHIGLVRSLLDQSANINAKGSGGATALMMACWWGHLEIVRLLLDRGANVNARGADGYTPLMEAARYGRFEVAELLLERGADVNAKTAEGKTAHRYAKEKGNTQLQELLAHYGAKPS